MIKTALRKTYLARQQGLSAIERANKSERIADNFFQSFDLSKVQFLHCYLPIERTNEIATRIIFEHIWRDFPLIKTFVPRVNRQTNEIESVEFTSETVLQQNHWQIDEPTHGETVGSEKIDMILVPLLCFDMRGFRVGYGKGFYDKFLAGCRTDCVKIGLSYFAPLEIISDAQSFDVKLDFCITPEEVFTFLPN